VNSCGALRAQCMSDGKGRETNVESCPAPEMTRTEGRSDEAGNCRRNPPNTAGLGFRFARLCAIPGQQTHSRSCHDQLDWNATVTYCCQIHLLPHTRRHERLALVSNVRFIIKTMERSSPPLIPRFSLWVAAWIFSITFVVNLLQILSRAPTFRGGLRIKVLRSYK